MQDRLVRLPFKGIVTTNYDGGLLEARHSVRTHDFGPRFATWKNTDAVGRWLNRDIFKETFCPILFAHGIYDDIDTIVLAMAEYRRAYDHSFIKLMESLYLQERLLFVGFGFTDTWLESVFEGSRTDSIRHFALIGLPEDRMGQSAQYRYAWRTSYNAEVVFYPMPATDGGSESHAALLPLLDDLVTDCPSPRPADVARLKTDAKEALDGGELDTADDLLGQVAAIEVPEQVAPQSEDALADRQAEDKPPTHADVPVRVREADTSAKLAEKLPEIADHPRQSGLQAAAPSVDADAARLRTDAKVAPDDGEFDTDDNLAKADELKALQHAAARALGMPVKFRDQLNMGTEGPEMMVIPAGSFRMGDISGNGDATEKPVHAVTIKRHFAIGRYSVTFDEYDLFCEATKRSKPSDERWGRGRRPVINASWEDANAFCKWLSEQSDLVYRLPSEAEWEYAARGGTESSCWWGETFDPKLAHCGSAGPVPADRFKPNPFGLYQVHGNVWEWVQDVWHQNYREAPDDGSAQSEWPTRTEVRRGTRPSPMNRFVPNMFGMVKPIEESYSDQQLVKDESAGHVLRGGSWKDQPVCLRSSARESELKSRDNVGTTGFRIARDFDLASQPKTKAQANEQARTPSRGNEVGRSTGKGTVARAAQSDSDGDDISTKESTQGQNGTSARNVELEATTPEAEVGMLKLPFPADWVLSLVRDALDQIE